MLYLVRKTLMTNRSAKT